MEDNDSFSNIRCTNASEFLHLPSPPSFPPDDLFTTSDDSDSVEEDDVSHRKALYCIKNAKSNALCNDAMNYKNSSRLELLETISESGSLVDENRLKYLFDVCDVNGDGYIDSNDLSWICKELNLEDIVDEIMHQLGADDQGRISFEDFIKSRQSVKSEIDAIRMQNQLEEITSKQELPCNSVESFIPTSSENSLGKHESWEFDSGARDLSPEPGTLRKLIEASGRPVTENTENMLELASRLHEAALSSLRREIVELKSKLEGISKEKNRMEKSLGLIQVERAYWLESHERALEYQAQQYEERLTELHSVIAELTRKLQIQKSHTILEEVESVNSAGDQSNCNDTASIDELSYFEPLKIEDSPISDFPKPMVNEVHSNTKRDVLKQSCNEEERKTNNSDMDRGAIALRSSLAEKDAEISDLKKALQLLADERDNLIHKLEDARSRPEVRRVGEVSPRRREPVNPCPLYPPSFQEKAPITKLAERVKLKTSNHPTKENESPSDVDGELCQPYHKMFLPGPSEDQIEKERLSCKLDHMAAEMVVLRLTLQESQLQCINLSTLIGKWESNCMALSLTARVSEDIISGLESLVSILEAGRNLLLACCASLSRAELLQIDPQSTLMVQAINHKRSVEKLIESKLSQHSVNLENPQPTTYNVNNLWNIGKDGEQDLRHLVQSMKEEKKKISVTVQKLESVFVDPLPKISVNELGLQKYDLEQSVILQELMGLREDKVELRAQLVIVQKEQKLLEMKVQYLESELQANKYFEKFVDRLLKNENDQASNNADPNNEILKNLHRASKLADLRNEQANALISDLKKANLILLQTLERYKRKSALRAKRLEQQMLSMVDSHSAQVQALVNKLSTQQIDSKPRFPAVNETSL